MDPERFAKLSVNFFVENLKSQIHAHRMSEQVFNLQLAFQKLEEEVKLYRNGTTAENLLELIEEKDREVSQLKTALSEATDKLRRIAKGSSELITKCERLQKEREEGLRSEKALIDRISGLEGALHEQSVDISSLRAEKAMLGEEISCLHGAVESYMGNLDKLQSRCAVLVSEKLDLERQFEKEKMERRENIKEFGAQLEKGIKFNMDIKQRLRSEQVANQGMCGLMQEVSHESPWILSYIRLIHL